jgi:thiamine kinase-like enzyme
MTSILKNKKVDLREELKKIFPNKKIFKLDHYGNSKIFYFDDKIIKYLPKNYFNPYIGIYNLLKRKTNIRLPEILHKEKSRISNNYIVVMKKNEDNPLCSKWECFNEKEKKVILERIASLLKKINSISLDPKKTSKSLIFFSRDVGWRGEVREFCLSRLDKYKKKGFIKKNLYDFLLSALNKNIDYITETDYVLLHNDLNFGNILINQNLDLTLLFDFETFSIGDKYLDLIITGSFLERKYQKMFFNFYGKPRNFEEISKVYRLIILMNFFEMIKGEKEAIRFVEKGFPLLNLNRKIYEKS